MKLFKLIPVLTATILVTGCESLYRAGLYIDCAAHSRLSIHPSTLASGKVGLTYRKKLHVRKAIFYVHLLEGRLPKGLKLSHRQSSDEFYITGVPLESGSFRIVIEAMGYGSMCTGPSGKGKYILLIK